MATWRTNADIGIDNEVGRRLCARELRQLLMRNGKFGRTVATDSETRGMSRNARAIRISLRRRAKEKREENQHTKEGRVYFIFKFCFSSALATLLLQLASHYGYRYIYVEQSRIFQSINQFPLRISVHWHNEGETRIVWFARTSGTSQRWGRLHK